jgi:hypothetical protein
MKKFAKRKLHSGSKTGPVVTNPRQAKAIAASEARAEKKHGGRYPDRKKARDKRLAKERL